jgi:hypothetical protein
MDIVMVLLVIVKLFALFFAIAWTILNIFYAIYHKKIEGYDMFIQTLCIFIFVVLQFHLWVF